MMMHYLLYAKDIISKLVASFLGQLFELAQYLQAFLLGTLDFFTDQAMF